MTFTPLGLWVSGRERAALSCYCVAVVFHRARALLQRPKMPLSPGLVCESQPINRARGKRAVEHSHSKPSDSLCRPRSRVLNAATVPDNGAIRFCNFYRLARCCSALHPVGLRGRRGRERFHRAKRPPWP